MNTFEKASDAIEKDRNYEMYNENVIEWLKFADKATVSFSSKKYINKIRELARRYPEEVEIVADYEDSIVAYIPTSYIHINRMKRELTEEQKESLKERANQMRRQKNEKR